jgi:hypothetical protein
MDNIRRIDPVGCICTDCLTGHSVPLSDDVPQDLIVDMINGRVQNATSAHWTLDLSGFDAPWLSALDHGLTYALTDADLHGDLMRGLVVID